MSASCYSAARRYGVLLTATIGFASFVGCGGPPPLELPKVKGIVRAKGGAALTGGMIEFRNTSDPNKRSTGAVDHQGAFELTTGDTNTRHPGVHPGQYEVSVYEPTSFAKRSAARAVTVPPEGLENVEIVVGEPAM